MLLDFFLNRVTAVDGKYQIGVYTLRPIAEGEEITFDYNSVTEVSTFLVPL
jgi:SET domain-containing protein